MTALVDDLPVNTAAAERTAADLGLSFRTILDRWAHERHEAELAAASHEEGSPEAERFETITASGFSALGPSVDIEFPTQNAPPTVSLLSSVRDVTGVLDAAYGRDRWVNGIEFEPEHRAIDLAAHFPYFWQCPEATGMLWKDVTPKTGPGSTAWMPIPDQPSVVKWRPYTAHTGDPCVSVMGWAGRDPRGRAKRLLQANLSRIVANELWTGARTGNAANSAQFGNNFLASSPTLPDADTPTGWMNALADLESRYHDLANTPGTIHCTVRTAAIWRSERLVFPSPTGRSLQTVFGNTVVPDAGYDGSGPAGHAAASRTQAWAYMTGPVVVAPRTESEGGWHEALDFGAASQVQDVHWRAMCETFAFWDSQVDVGVLVNLTTESS